MRKGKEKIKKLIFRMRSIRIRRRLAVMFIFATLIPVLGSGIISYEKSNAVIQEKVDQTVYELLNQVASSTEEKVETIKNQGIEISYMEEIQQLLKNYSEYNDRMKYQVKINVTREMSTKYIFNNSISEIDVYTPEQEITDVYGEDIFRLNLKKEYLTDFLDECKNKNGKSVFSAFNETQETRFADVERDAKRKIVLGKVVKDKNSGQALGYITLVIPEKEITQFFETVGKELESNIMILDKENRIIASNNEGIRAGDFYTEDQEILDALKKEKKDSFRIKDAIVNVHRLTNVDWTLVSVIPNEYLYADSQVILKNMLLVGAAGIILGILCTGVFSFSILSPLNKTIEGMDRFKKGDLQIRIEESGKDEITVLDRQFNSMADEITQLIRNIREGEKEKRNLEIQALQAQINPHFLSNTLNSVSFIAKMKQEKTIEVLINAIIDLLRVSMKNTESIHTAREEMSLLQDYITIQEYRFFGKFSVQYRVPEELLAYKIPKFVLQPIVENAIVHGIEPSSRRGVIRIKACKKQDKLIFEVLDNGIGMSPDQAAGVLNKKKEAGNTYNGIGMGNVEDRIRLSFGSDYGLKIRSKEGFGTRVTITLPCNTENV